MKILTLFTILILTIKSFGQLNNCDSIIWNQTKKLVWNNFQAKADSLSQYGAISFVGISYKFIQINDSLQIEVSCFFKPCASWTKFRLNNDTALIHEQTHFDISEFYKRLFIKRLLEYPFTKTNFSNAIKEIYAEIKIQKNRMDDSYDTETDFHINSKQQIIWTKKINKSIDDLNLFDRSILNFQLKN